MLEAAADVLIIAGHQAGLSVRDLINLLDAGMSTEQFWGLWSYCPFS